MMETRVALKIYFAVGAMAVLFSAPVYAIDLDSMIAKVTGKPAPTTTQPNAQKDLAAAAGVASGPEKMAVVPGGNCGFASKVFGCPEKGIVVPPNMPELKTTLSSLMGLANASSATPDGRRGLLHLADGLSKISPEKVMAQVEVLKNADPAYQFGAVRQVRFPEMGEPIRNPTKFMQGMINDARGKGDKFQEGAKKSLVFLQQIHARAKTKKQKAFLQTRITNLSNLINSGAIPLVAKQAVSPFFDPKGNPKINPQSKKPVTTDEAAITMMLMSVEGDLQDSDDDRVERAQIRSEREFSLEDYE